jgi:DNA-binding LytR/AlgR family response regulator
LWDFTRYEVERGVASISKVKPSTEDKTDTLMDLRQRNSNQADNGKLLDSGDSHIHAVAKAAGKGLRKRPIPPVVSRHERATATFENEPSLVSRTNAREALSVSLVRRDAGRTASLSEVLEQLLTLAMRQPARMAFKSKGRILFIDVADVTAVEARGNYVVLRHRSCLHLLRESISTMEEKLTPHHFVRIHRSVLVNGALVEELQPRSGGEYLLRLRGGWEYTVSRSYKKNVHRFAQSWIGTGVFVAK